MILHRASVRPVPMRSWIMKERRWGCCGICHSIAVLDDGWLRVRGGHQHLSTAGAHHRGIGAGMGRNMVAVRCRQDGRTALQAFDRPYCGLCSWPNPSASSATSFRC